MSAVQMASRRDTETWPVFESDEMAAVQSVLESGKVNYWTGSVTREFEHAWGQKVGTKFGLAAMNGTVTMELAMIALGVGPGDEVVVPSRTFVATALAVMNRGAIPIFADVDPMSGNVTAETIAKVLTPKTRAIIPVHIGGWPCEMAPIMELARQRNLFVIEDCAQAHGARIDGQMVGSFGDINSWSFCQDKIMTLGGEGGAVTTDNEAWWKAMWAFKDHGKCYDTVYHKHHEPGFRWLHEGQGTNWRMLEVQAAIGLCQIQKLDAWVEKRRRLARILTEALSGQANLVIPEAPSNFTHSYYRWYAKLDPASLKEGWTRDRVCDEVSKRGSVCQVGSCSEIYLEKAFDHGLRPASRLPEAHVWTQQSLVLLTHPTLKEESAHRAADTLATVLREATR